jgi:hypothetical protein
MKTVAFLIITGIAWSTFIDPAVARSHHKSQEQTAPPSQPTQPAPPPPDDTAKFLAGIPVPKNSPLAPLSQTPAWRQHAGFFEQAFAKLNVQKLDKLHAWQNSYLPESKASVPVAFYMFSGPDFLYVDQFFPNASVYVLCGKESMGPAPDPLRMSNLSGALHNLENAMYSSLHTSYFITKDMKVDLEQQNLNGTLPILYVFLARGDKTIHDVTFISLDHGGGVHESRAGTGGTPGVRINFRDNHSGRSQTMYYFTTDISDGGISSSPAFMSFCHQFGVGDSFLKSSSYLMFEEGFSRVRNFILDHSNQIVQDDSGIPVQYFNHDKWNLRLFGTYVGPIELFKEYNQPKLRELFGQNNPPPLGIGFGYQWNYTKSNLIVAQRK